MYVMYFCNVILWNKALPYFKGLGKENKAVGFQAFAGARNGAGSVAGAVYSV